MHRFRNSRIQEVQTEFQNITWLDEVNHCCSKCRRTNFFSSSYELSIPSLFYLPSISYVLSFLSAFISSFTFLSSIYFLSSIFSFFLKLMSHSFSFSLSSILLPILIPYSFLLLSCTVLIQRLKTSPKTHFAWGGACTYAVCVYSWHLLRCFLEYNFGHKSTSLSGSSFLASHSLSTSCYYVYHNI